MKKMVKFLSAIAVFCTVFLALGATAFASSGVFVSGVNLVPGSYYLVTGDREKGFSLTTEFAHSDNYNVTYSNTGGFKGLFLNNYIGGPIEISDSVTATEHTITLLLSTSSCTVWGTSSAPAINNKTTGDLILTTPSNLSLSVCGYNASGDTGAVNGGDAIISSGNIKFQTGNFNVFGGASSETGTLQGNAIATSNIATGDITFEPGTKVNVTMQNSAFDPAQKDNNAVYSARNVIMNSDKSSGPSSLIIDGGGYAVYAEHTITINGGVLKNTTSYNGIRSDGNIGIQILDYIDGDYKQYSNVNVSGNFDPSIGSDTYAVYLGSSDITIEGNTTFIAEVKYSPTLNAQAIRGDLIDNLAIDYILIGKKPNYNSEEYYITADNDYYILVKTIPFTVTQGDVTYNGNTSLVDPVPIIKVATGHSISYLYSGRDGTVYDSSTVKPLDVGKYTCTTLYHGGTAGSGLTLARTTTNFEITPLELTYNIDDTSPITKPYDNTTSTTGVTATCVTAMPSGAAAPDVTVSNAAYTSAGAGNNKTITADIAFASGSNPNGNYTLSNTQITSTAVHKIEPLQLTWATNGIANSKKYDGTTVATQLRAPTLAGILSTETNVPTVKQGTLNFASTNVAPSVPITATGYTVENLNGNYLAPTYQPSFDDSTIELAIYPSAGTTLTASGEKGKNGIVSLQNWSSLQGASFSSVQATGANIILDGAPTITGTGSNAVLNFKLLDDSSLIGTTTSVTFIVHSDNYESFIVTVNITMVNREVPVLYISNHFKEYDGKTFTNNDIEGTAKDVNGNVIEGAFSFATAPTIKDAEGVTYVDVIFTPNDTAKYETATTHIALSIYKKNLYVTTTLSALEINVGEALPTVSLTYSGLVDGETLTPTLQPIFSGMPANSTTGGTYQITLANLAQMQAEIEKMPDAKNYSLFYSNTTATFKIVDTTGLNEFPYNPQGNINSAGSTLPQGARLIAGIVSDNALARMKDKAHNLGLQGEIVYIADLFMVDSNGYGLEPDANTRIRIDVPGLKPYDVAWVLHLKADGTIEKIPATCYTDYVEFTPTSFSPYSVVVQWNSRATSVSPAVAPLTGTSE